jgi:hypothetical protein
VLVGAISFFTTLYPFGLFAGLMGAFFGSLAGLFFVVMFEMANIQIEKLDEMKKQTALIEELLQKKDNEIIPHN